MYVFAYPYNHNFFLGFLEESDSSLSNIELYDLDGEQLSLESDLTAARHPSHTGVLKIVYETKYER